MRSGVLQRVFMHPDVSNSRCVKRCSLRWRNHPDGGLFQGAGLQSSLDLQVQSGLWLLPPVLLEVLLGMADVCVAYLRA